MPLTAEPIAVQRDAPIPTWFGVGGRADRLATPASVDDLRRCVEADPALRVLGDGANLLVDDAGVGELVVALSSPAFTGVRWPESPRDARVIAGAGANLPRMLIEAARRGLAGLEGLGGIPATLGGAVLMNAGGRFGQVADAVERVHALDRTGGVHAVECGEIDFGYRRSGLDDLIITSVELRLTLDDPARVRDRLRDVMAYKKATQPLGARSAGCAFRNPTLDRDVPGVGRAGERVSAGRIIDRAGCKGARVGGAEVSDAHGNFLVARPGASARDVIRLMELVERRVLDAFGLALEREVVIWSRSS